MFGDLPDEIVCMIGAHLGLEGTWRSLDEVVRDQASLAMTARSAAPLADMLASQIQRHLKVAETTATRAVARPNVPPSLNHVRSAITDSTSMKDARAAAAECGIKGARSRAETLSRVEEAINVRERDIVELTKRQESFDAHSPHAPIRISPVPGDLRARCLEPQRLTATGARERFLLTDRDLADLPAMLKRNPYFSSAAPMRLIRVSDLREAAERKYGGIQFLDAQKRKRSDRAERTVRAASEARQKRRQVLVYALEERGCELRGDSRLCATYLHTGQGDVKRIADTMAEMAFCHRHTRYREILSGLISQHREWGERYDIHELSHEARSEAVSQFVRRGTDLHLLPAHLR